MLVDGPNTVGLMADRAGVDALCWVRASCMGLSRRDGACGGTLTRMLACPEKPRHVDLGRPSPGDCGDWLGGNGPALDEAQQLTLEPRPLEPGDGKSWVAGPSPAMTRGRGHRVPSLDMPHRASRGVQT